MTEDQFARFVEYSEGRFQTIVGRLEVVATKDDLAQLEGRLEARLTSEIGSLRQEMRERFEIVHDRLVALEKGYADLSSGVAKLRDHINEQIAQLNARLDKLEVQGRETSVKLIDLREEMQQRFRILMERLAALENRIAA